MVEEYIDKAVTVQDIIERTAKAKAVTNGKVRDIRTVTSMLKILALNALIEANRAGDLGRGFSVVADEVRGISVEVEGLSSSLARELGGELSMLETLTQDMALQSQGARLTDLALNAIELIDRNLYERTCDVRWWATDAALVEAATDANAETCAYAAKRLGVILDAYTVYIDLWLCDLSGNIIASGRPGQYGVAGHNVTGRDWFQRARALLSGNDFAVADIMTEPLLNGAQIATYATGVRAGGEGDGKLLGILGVHFDWQPQAQTIMTGIRLGDEERTKTRALLVDASGLVIAASDGKGILSERLQIKSDGRESGHYRDPDGTITAYHKTPGYETYAGLGWRGVLVQRP